MGGREGGEMPEGPEPELEPRPSRLFSPSISGPWRSLWGLQLVGEVGRRWAHRCSAVTRSLLHMYSCVTLATTELGHRHCHAHFADEEGVRRLGGEWRAAGLGGRQHGPTHLLAPAHSGRPPARRHSPQPGLIRHPALGPLAAQAPSGGGCSPRVSLRGGRGWVGEPPPQQVSHSHWAALTWTGFFFSF